MENKENKTISNSNDASSHIDVDEDPSPPPSPSRATDAKPPSLLARTSSPAKSSVSSDLSHSSSPSHGSSHVEEKRPESPPLTVPAKPPSPAPARSPAESSVLSDLSHHSSVSRGSSPVEEKRQPLNVPPKPALPAPSQLVFNRSVRDEAGALTKVDPGAGYDSFNKEVEDGGVHSGGGGSVCRGRRSLSILNKVRREAIVKRAALGFRICGLVFCLISLSVMAADTKKGWAIDSFYRYKEFRYCISVNAIGFVYSVFQAYDMVRYFSTGKHLVRHRLRHYVDFSLDQMLTYLLMSASTSAATRVDDWQANWGKDKFPEMASASVGMSFLAFVALALSSLISGYAVCTSRYS
ncbi:hypothetical protein NMG60_11006623 [Bertholletia excelsa]